MFKTDDDNLVTTDWLARRIVNTNVQVIDASFFVPGGSILAKQKYDEEHIPGAVFFDINDIADPDSSLAHTMPTEATFAEKVGLLGISNDDHVIAYDGMGGACAAARAWWMFSVFGHKRVSVLDGGIAKWKKEHCAIETNTPPAVPQSYTAVKAKNSVRTSTELLNALEECQDQIVDARSAGRFSGSEPEPHEGLRKGHIPGSVNLPWTNLMDVETQTFKPLDAIANAFEACGVDLDKPFTATCGSGVTACTLAFAACLLGKTNTKVYDGSWVEWGANSNLPIASGPSS